MILQRFAYTPAATYGRLADQIGGNTIGSAMLYTVERPWRGNAPWVSCIPCGTYQLAAGKFRGTYPGLRVLDVPGRTAIWMHRANRPTELQGCIGVGSDFGADGAVLGSADALALLVAAVADRGDYRLEIENALGLYAAPAAWAAPDELRAVHARLRTAEVELERSRADLLNALRRDGPAGK